MKSYTVHTLFSGTSDFDLWVTVRFASEETQDDVVHIVCALDVDDQDEALGMNTIYLERDDQARGGYGLVDRVVVSGEGVELFLNAKGCDRMGFAEPIRLAWAGQIEGKAGALQTLGEMREYEYGRAVEIIGETPA